MTFLKAYEFLWLYSLSCPQMIFFSLGRLLWLGSTAPTCRETLKSVVPFVGFNDVIKVLEILFYWFWVLIDLWCWEDCWIHVWNRYHHLTMEYYFEEQTRRKIESKGEWELKASFINDAERIKATELSTSSVTVWWSCTSAMNSTWQLLQHINNFENKHVLLKFEWNLNRLSCEVSFANVIFPT